MLDFGWQEFLVVAIVTVLIVGPKELPRVFRTITGFMRKARSLAGEFHSAMDEMAKDADLQDLKKQAQGLKDGSSDWVKEIDPTGEVDSTIKDMKSEVDATRTAVNAAGRSETASSTTSSTSGSETPASPSPTTPAPAVTAAATAAATTAASPKKAQAKATAKKATAKKAGTKKAAAKKVTAKKATTKKAAAKKTSAKKSGTKKATANPAPAAAPSNTPQDTQV